MNQLVMIIMIIITIKTENTKKSEIITQLLKAFKGYAFSYNIKF